MHDGHQTAPLRLFFVSKCLANVIKTHQLLGWYPKHIDAHRTASAFSLENEWIALCSPLSAKLLYRAESSNASTDLVTNASLSAEFAMCACATKSYLVAI